MNANPKRIKKDAFSKRSGYVWTGPESNCDKSVGSMLLFQQEMPEGNVKKGQLLFYGALESSLTLTGRKGYFEIGKGHRARILMKTRILPKSANIRAEFLEGFPSLFSFLL